MKALLHTFFLLALTHLFPACSKAEWYEQRAKSVDSLGGALGVMTTDLSRQDTISIQKAAAQFGHYSSFIALSVKDTISKTAADQLRRFYQAGLQLQAYTANHNILLNRAGMLSSQLQRLSADIRHRALLPEEMDRYVAAESAETTRLLTAARDQQIKLATALSEYRLSLPYVEQLIRSHNRGELPVIVKDSLDL